MTASTRTPAPTTIVFGTDGWRARIADDFTFENVRRCADGVASYVTERGATAKGVGRWMPDELVKLAEQSVRKREK